MVPGSAGLIFPATHIIEDAFLVENSNRIELTFSRIDLSEYNLQVEEVVNKSVESRTIDNLTSVQSYS